LIYTYGTGLGEAREWRMSDTQKGVAYDFNAGASFHANGTRYFYFCTKDGTRCISSAGDEKWHFQYGLTKPVAVSSGDKLAVGESKGRHIYVFDQNGLYYDVVLSEPALGFFINSNGYLAVVLQLEQGYAVNVYNQKNNSNPLFYRRIYESWLVPVAADVSEDGKFAAIALLDTEVHLSLRVNFHYINQRDTTSPDGLFGAVLMQRQFPLALKFLDKNRVVVATDERFACYALGDMNACDLAWEMPLQNELDLLAFGGGSHFAFVAGEKLLNEPEALEPGTLAFVSAGGDVTGTFEPGRKATHLSLGHGAALVGAGRNFYAVSPKGVRLWEYVSLQDTRQMLFLENTDTVLLAGNARATVLKRVRQKLSEMQGDGFGLND
ncbi:MAG: DUF5711 family protein, partial [Defluviitaleaceae bacterium]|nr:DUF5711 family protein [Defluviitaleaceae bacterium]